MQDYKIKLKGLINELKLKGIYDKKVLNAIEKTPRHLFVPIDLQEEAYGDYPLPLLKGQTISQPYTVAFMLQKLNLKKGLKVLEVGTGSGWNVALIAQIIKPTTVYTTEIIPDLVKLATNNIKKVKIKNIKIFKKDGSKGLKQYAPFDRIIFTAAAQSIPKKILSQLKDNGVMLVPVGQLYGQKMLRLTKKGKEIKQEYLGDFVFVPLKH